MMLVVYYTQI